MATGPTIRTLGPSALPLNKTIFKNFIHLQVDDSAEAHHSSHISNRHNKTLAALRKDIQNVREFKQCF